MNRNIGEIPMIQFVIKNDRAFVLVRFFAEIIVTSNVKEIID